MMEKQLEHAHRSYSKCISWSALIVGAVIGMGLSFLLNLFSISIGLSVFTIDKTGLVTLALGGLLGLLIGVIAVMFAAGFAAGYLGRSYCKRNLGIIYGFTTWCLMLILTVLMAAHIGRYVTAYSHFVSNPTVIKITTDEQAPTVSGKPDQQVTVNVEKATNTMGMGAFIIFVLFFVGALSSSFGGYYGMACKEESCRNVK